MRMPRRPGTHDAALATTGRTKAATAKLNRRSRSHAVKDSCQSARKHPGSGGRAHKEPEPAVWTLSPGDEVCLAAGPVQRRPDVADDPHNHPSRVVPAVGVVDVDPKAPAQRA